MNEPIFVEPQIETIVRCLECNQLWGIVFFGRDKPDSVVAFHGLLILIDEYIQERACDEHIVTNAELWTMDLPKLVEIVYITEAHAGFCADKGFEEILPDCWQEIAELNVPAWLLKGRKHRWALRMKCRCW